MNTLTDLAVRKLSPALGAEIAGLDLRRPLDAATVAEILRLWHEHLVLVFPGQELATEQQRRFAANFGTLRARRRATTRFARAPYAVYDGDPEIRDDPNLMLVSNVTVDGQPIGSFAEGDMWFHIDSGYAECPYKYTLLYAVKLPSSGGNTRFANMYRAYETLPDALKAKLEGRKAVHVHEYKRVERIDPNADFSSSPHFAHPVFVTHPDTRRKTLFVDRLMTARLEGFAPDESEAILTQLFDHLEQPQFIYEHVWRPGDLVMWDNRCVVHGRTWFPETEQRILRRCTIEGGPLHE